MEKPSLPRKQRVKPLPDDDTLLEAGRAALVGKLGVSGALRFLRLLGGGHDRWDLLRRAWANVSMRDLQAQMRRDGLLADFGPPP